MPPTVEEKRQRNRERSIAFQSRLREKLDNDPQFATKYRAHRAELARLQRQRDIEKARGVDRIQYAANRSRELDKMKRWREANREQFNEIQRESYREHRPERLARMKEWKTLNPDYERNRKLVTQYGITLEEKYRMIKTQHGLCAACGEPLDLDSHYGSALAPCVDHHHESDCLREIIHRQCNIAIGMLRDDPAVLRKVAEYLEKHIAIREAACA